jgi:hypothetical protein
MIIIVVVVHTMTLANTTINNFNQSKWRLVASAEIWILL